MKNKRIIILIIAFSLFLAACSNTTTNNTKKETVIETNPEIVNESIKETKLETYSENETESETSNNSIGKNHNGIEKVVYKADEIKEMMKGSYKGDKKIAFLTFDDGPTKITEGILDVLKDKDVRATFFVMGKKITDETASILKRIYDEGNSIASHSFYHDYETLYPGRIADADVIVAEHKKSIEAMKKYLGDDFDTNVFRYPGGHMSWDQESLKVSDKALKDIGVEWIDWNTMNGDAQPKKMPETDISRPTTVEEVISNFDKSKTFIPNTRVIVVLMHDAGNKQLTLDALPDLIDHIKSQGYEFGIIE